MCAIAAATTVDDAHREDRDRGTRRTSRPRSRACATPSARAASSPRSSTRPPRRATRRGMNASAIARSTSTRLDARCTRRAATSSRSRRSRARSSRSARGVHVDVADALVVLDHRHARVLGDEADQALAAARDAQVDQIVELDELGDRLAVRASARAGPRRAAARPPRARLARSASERAVRLLTPRGRRAGCTRCRALRHSAAASVVTFGRAS